MADDIDVDGLAARIAKRLGSWGGGGDGDDDPDLDTGRGRVPVDRLRREIDKRKAAEQALAAVGADVEALRVAHAADLKRWQEETAKEVQRISGAHAEDLSLVELGIGDRLGREAVRMAWQGTDKATRGASPAEWWQGITTAVKKHAADPEKAAAPEVPRVLAAYLPQAEAKVQQQQGTRQLAAGAGRGGPPGDNGRQQRGGGGAMDFDVTQGMDAFLRHLKSIG